jgi:hypothetical protein
MTRTAPKVVLFWHMRAKGDGKFKPHDPREVDQAEWLPLEAAFERLSYEHEQRVLEEAARGSV